MSEDCTAACLSGHVVKLVNGFHCDVKLVDETCNGVEVIADDHNGEQKLITGKHKAALIVHHYAYLLSLSAKTVS
jgi:hypothetical protein